MTREASHYGIAAKRNPEERAEHMRSYMRNYMAYRRRGARIAGHNIGFLVASAERDVARNQLRDGSGLIWPCGNIGSETPGTDANRLIDEAEKRHRRIAPPPAPNNEKTQAPQRRRAGAGLRSFEKAAS
jgi:hypothetical protein